MINATNNKMNEPAIIITINSIISPLFSSPPPCATNNIAVDNPKITTVQNIPFNILKNLRYIKNIMYIDYMD